VRLVSVTLRNYRIHRETTVRFDRALTVIGGPNESGKSTVVEAVHRALFLRARVTGAVLESMRSHLHAGHPAVELTFESGGTTYTVTKQFTGTNAAPTTLAPSGQPSLRNEQAEERLQAILGAEAVSGRGAEDRLRLEWAHLWVWQGAAAADPLDRGTIGGPLDRLRERLGSLDGGDVLESRRDAAVAAAVATTHAARTKDNGEPKAGSPLGLAVAALAEARGRRTAAQAVIDALEGALAEVERADATIAETETSLAARRQEQADNERQLEDARRLELRQAEEQAAATAAAARLAAATEGDRQIRECETRLAEIEKRRTPAAVRKVAGDEAEREAEKRSAEAQAAVRDAQRSQADVAELAELHGRAEHLERRRTERAGLGGRCARIAALRAEAAEMEGRLGGMKTVDAADLAELTALERRLDAAQATLDAIATRVELVAADRQVRLGEHDLATGVPETITADAMLAVGETRLRISPGGGTSLTEATRRRDEARGALDARLRTAGVADVDEARRVQPLRQSVQSALDAKRAAIDDLGGGQAEADLARLDDEIAALEQALAQASRPDVSRPTTLAEATAARQALDGRLHDLVQALAAATAAQQAADTRLSEARAERDRAHEAARAIDDEWRTERARQAVLVEEHGGDRTEALAAAAAASRAADTALASTMAAIQRLQPELLRQASGRLARAVEKLTESRQAAQASRTIALERLRNEGTLDPRADLAQATVEERLAEARHAQAAREARAYALLAALFAEKKREVEARFVGPLTGRVADYLRCVFGGDAGVTVDYADGQFKGLSLARPGFGGVAIAFRELSGGGREQVAAAFRLAMAEILAAEHDGCLPIVFDDAFVNSDPVRVAAVHAMLDLAASRGLQVILLSCNHRDYDALGAAPVMLASEPAAGVAPLDGGDV
jgi:DNA repair exonuclease SbcCD ATPase subunit